MHSAGRHPVQSNIEQASYWWNIGATCKAFPCDIWELLVSQGIPLLSSMLHFSNFRTNMLPHRRSIPQGGLSDLHQDSI